MSTSPAALKIHHITASKPKVLLQVDAARTALEVSLICYTTNGLILLVHYNPLLVNSQCLAYKSRTGKETPPFHLLPALSPGHLVESADKDDCEDERRWGEKCMLEGLSRGEIRTV